MGEHNCYMKNIHECIKEKAYEIWENDGCKEGQDLDYWLIAENTVKKNEEEISVQSHARKKEPVISGGREAALEEWQRL